MILTATRKPPFRSFTVDLTKPVPIKITSKYPFGFICTEIGYDSNFAPDSCEFLLANLDEPHLFQAYLDQHPEYFI